MTKEDKFILNLISFALNVNVKDGFLWADKYTHLDKTKVVYAAQKHMAISYFSLLKDERFAFITENELVRNTSDRFLSRCLLQDYQWEAIKETFEKNGIKCIPLKGIDIRKYYPDI